MNKIGLIFTAALICATTAAEAAQPTGKIAGTVNGTTIRTDFITKRLWTRYGNVVLEEAINETLLLAEAGKRDIMPSSGEIEGEMANLKAAYPDKAEFAKALKEQGLTEEDARTEVKTRLAIRKLAISWGKLTNSDEELKQFFEANKASLGTPAAVRLRQIYSKTRQEAQDMLLALKAGADFATLAAQKAVDEQAAKTAGDVGYAYKDQLLPEVSAAVFKLAKGEYTDIIETKKGCVILKVEDIRPAVEADFDKMKNALSNALLQKKIEALLPQILAQLRKESVIKDNTK